MSKKRFAAAGLFLALGLTLAVVTATVMRGKGINAMQTAGQASLYAAIGLALLASPLVRAVTARLAGPLEQSRRERLPRGAECTLAHSADG